MINNGITSLCITKLDVLDGLDEVKICVGYKLGDEVFKVPPMRVEQYADCEPVYEVMPGWSGNTAGITDLNVIPAEARAYLRRIEELLLVPIDIISTGPDREETIILKHPFD
jgi:adenylosuccinate synthase